MTHRISLEAGILQFTVFLPFAPSIRIEPTSPKCSGQTSLPTRQEDTHRDEKRCGADLPPTGRRFAACIGSDVPTAQLREQRLRIVVYRGRRSRDRKGRSHMRWPRRWPALLTRCFGGVSASALPRLDVFGTPIVRLGSVTDSVTARTATIRPVN